jgi:replication-associated recombination protein RarA
MTGRQGSLPLKDQRWETAHKLDPYECVSALQKCIRRNMEREAMWFACEMLHTSRALCTWLCRRLQVISHEDIDTQASPHVLPFVKAACDQVRVTYQGDIGLARMMIGNAIRMMCRAPKSREGDHFQAAVWLEKAPPTSADIPDWALDKHTRRGKALGRGLDHFRSEGAKLVPEAPKDKYEEEAYRAWAIQEKRERLEKGAAFREFNYESGS